MINELKQVSLEEDNKLSNLRPKKFDEFYGQKELKENLQIFIQASKGRDTALDHILLNGPPGLGKTTLANIIATELDESIRFTSGPVIERQGDLAAILSNLEMNQVLFIDEIHRLNKTIEETLYSAMEDFSLDIIIGQGAGAQTIQISLPQFTLIGATTRSGLLSAPLRDRFGIQLNLDYYEVPALEKIILHSAAKLNTNIYDEACKELALRSRGTPRIANRLLKRTIDFADALTDGVINQKVVEESLKRLSIDQYGLEKIDRMLLFSILDKYSGGPVGLSTLSVLLSEEKDTIETVREPFLIRQGLLQRTHTGRILTEKGIKLAKEFTSEFNE